MRTERDTRHLTYHPEDLTSHRINRGATRSYSDLALLHNCNAVDCIGHHNNDSSLKADIVAILVQERHPHLPEVTTATEIPRKRKRCEKRPSNSGNKTYHTCPVCLKGQLRLTSRALVGPNTLEPRGRQNLLQPGKLRGLSAPWTVRRLSSSLGPLQYPELDEKIMAARQKDMPVSDMPNPFEREKAQCVLCRLKLTPDYKNAKLLSQFVSPYTGRIYGRHITGLCLRQQQLVEEEIIKSQNVGFMAYYLKQVEFLHDPKLFDPERPIRNHRF
uniref:Mitochondrial ribosomal protein S18C n=1 Tax=Timema bartmani TaxID=61472 RepID=A0A7R9ET05_9NEOP|nr:unnamed protein product [Timema bartmani]